MVYYSNSTTGEVHFAVSIAYPFFWPFCLTIYGNEGKSLAPEICNIDYKSVTYEHMLRIMFMEASC